MSSFFKNSSRICLLLFALLCALDFAGIMAETGNHFSFALDDPYIHLAMAERIAQHHHYGINLGETTSPSSSIVWPFLLLIGVGQWWHQFVALGWNLFFGAITVFLLGRVIDRWHFKHQYTRWLLCLVLVFATNQVGLVYMGMEHTLQCAMVALIALGILDAFDNKRIGAFTIVIAALSTAVRYENILVLFALTFALWSQQRARTAFATLAASCVIPAAFGLFLMHHGLSPLPNSVLAKAGAYATEHSLFASIVIRIGAYLQEPERWLGPPFVLLTALLTLHYHKTDTRKAKILAGVFLALTLQLFFGRFGWFYRYEVYANVLALMTLFGVLATEAQSLVPVWSRKTLGWLTAGLVGFAGYYATCPALVPIAAFDIYGQNYQMHRFVDDFYQKNFAVNDLGWTSYQLDPHIYVLDVFGLANAEALHRTHKDAAWLEDITRRHNAGLAMIYTSWVEDIPDSWSLRGTLTLQEMRVSTGEPSVYIFATQSGDCHAIDDKLLAFRGTLPDRVSLTLNEAPCPIR